MCCIDRLKLIVNQGNSLWGLCSDMLSDWSSSVACLHIDLFKPGEVSLTVCLQLATLDELASFGGPSSAPLFCWSGALGVWCVCACTLTVHRSICKGTRQWGPCS